MMDIQEILAILPHRYPFLLVDRVLSFEAGKKMTALKNVSMNEPFFQGHFPGRPIMPGVLIVEAMAQLGGVLAFKSAKGKEGQMVYFLGIDKAKFRKPVLPGDQLRLEIEVLHQRPPYWKLKGEAYVEDQLVSEAELKAMLEKEAQ
ncbi:MAG: 3-hydroxyacyl-ACP dehydratase FabZ [Nitrospiria bacterium]